MKLSIIRDEFRKKSKEGRGVGDSVILGYVNKLKSAHNTYTTNSDDLIDRFLHFKWTPMGDSPIKGVWILKKDIKFHLSRKLNRD